MFREAPLPPLRVAKWQGIPVPYSEMTSVHSDNEFSSASHFELRFADHESALFVWLHVNGPLSVGTYQMPGDQWWIDLNWRPGSGPGLDQVAINDTGTLTITRFVENDGIAGSFDAVGGALTGSFDVSFVE